jgi:hypothetical protein
MIKSRQKLKSATITWFPASFTEGDKKFSLKEIYPESFHLNKILDDFNFQKINKQIGEKNENNK